MALISSLLRGKLVRLTALQEADLAVLARWSEDSAYMRLLDAQPAMPQPASRIKEDIEEMQKSSHAYVFGVRPLESDDLVGIAEVSDILWPHGAAWLGLGMGNAAWRGRGAGTEAGRLALDFAFQELNLHRINATVFSYNTASLRMCEKLGFSREGVFREFLQRDGQWHDMILLGILRREWEALPRP